MRLHQGLLLHSASDIVDFLECEHLKALDLQALLHPESAPKRCEDKDEVELIKIRGTAHEELYLDRLRESGRQITELKGVSGGLAQSVLETKAAMARGDEIIYQAALMHGVFAGYADFLLRVPGASRLGDWHYEVADTKLARAPKSKFMVQLCFYAALVAEIQGIPPGYVHLYFGDGSERSFRTADYSAYFAKVQEKYLGFVQGLLAPGCHPTYPTPMSYCGSCGWREACDQRWKDDDHLSQVANITQVQIDRLQESGVFTLASLAAVPAEAKVPKIHPEVLARLRHQAGLQLFKRETGQNRYDLLPIELGRGFSRLPRPDEGDLFFDMEGDPLEVGGLEYLFGVGVIKQGAFQFLDFWAHSRVEEKAAFEAFMDFVMAHLKDHPAAHIYHYAAYEATALKRLMSLHGTREAEVDFLLRRGKLVDLYKVVREGVRVSEPKYSIKNMEAFYAEKRTGEVKNAGASIVWYERWRETRDPQLLADIRSYNEDDCRSTWQLREWLMGLRPEGLAWFSADDQVSDLEQERKPWELQLESYWRALVNPLPQDPATWDDQARLRETTYQLLDFHRREAKPHWWAMFARMEMSEDELLEDMECLVGLTLDPEHPPVQDKRSVIYTYRFPEQETKLRTGSSVTDVSNGMGLNALTLDEEAQRAILRVGDKRPLPQRLSLGPGAPIKTDALQAALVRFADSVIAGDQRYSALESLLRRDWPKFRDRSPGMPIVGEGEPIQPGVVRAMADLEDSYLFIQGPPGAGKTYTGSRVIVEMLRRGKRMAIASNSHKAIHNLLTAIEKVAEEENFVFQGAKKVNAADPDTFFHGQMIRNIKNSDEVSPQDQLVAGTAWLFSRPECDQAFDFLVVDEAGQVTLANLLAMGTCARNLVLLGDPMQLGQPTQGVHPGHSGESGLEYLLQDRATVAPDRGVFLPTSWRMAPALCQFISDAVYDGRLEPEGANHLQKLVLSEGADSSLIEAGLRFLPTAHQGNSQRSKEEGDRIKGLYQSLLQQEFQDRHGVPRRVGVDDILVVAPYNLQVNLLRKVLPPGARVGTVDKFQGQEAPVVIVSMATSSEEHLPRDIGFLFSKNRLNVAISRAQCLALVVASPDLLTVHCSTVEQMALVNLLCWIAREGA